MARLQDATHEESQQYYEDFSLRIGMKDWLRPNARHARLRVLIEDALRGRNGLELLDVGCGAGVMTSHLTKYGNVVGTDFSHAAVRAAEQLVPEAEFFAGTFDALPVGRQYDVITLFDVLEHIPEADRPGFLRQLASLLQHGGVLFMSTPHPAATHRKRALADPDLQIIDEEVKVTDVVNETRSAGLELISYTAYDVFRGTPEYQAMVFRTASEQGDRPVLTDERAVVPAWPWWRRRNAFRVLGHGGRRSVARWLLQGSAPDIRS